MTTVALPVLRLSSDVLLRDGSLVSPDLIGLPASGLPKLHSIGRAGLRDHPQGWQLLVADAAQSWAHANGTPLVLTDDYAPVDQILTQQSAS